MKVFTFCFFLLLTRLTFSQEIPTYLMSEGTITTCNAYFLDEGGFMNGYAGPERTMTFTSGNASPLGVHFDSLRFYNDGENIAVYDGPDVNSPVLTVITRTSGSYSARATGNSLTFKFAGSYYGSTGKVGWRAHIMCLTDPEPTTFTSVYNRLFSGSIDVGDYDKDGDADILSGGLLIRNDTKNDSSYFFEKVFNPLGKWNTSSIDAKDFNKDGLTDIFIMGEVFTDGFYYKVDAAVYKNNGDGTFTRASQAFAPATQGKCEVVDINNDGLPDISYTGRERYPYVETTFKIYLNNGDFSFTELKHNLAGYKSSWLNWADSDNDGDLDLLLNGDDDKTSYSHFLVNNGNGSFTSTDAGLIGTHSGVIKWVDFNKDGKPDIFNTGIETPGYINTINPQILLNNGNNTFTPLSNNLPSLRTCRADFADYDGDDDIDLVISGSANYESYAYVYRNDGDGQFAKVNLPEAPASFSTVLWYDFTKDKKPDLLITNRYGYSYVAKNEGNDSFSVASLPMPVIVGLGEALIADFDNDSIPDILFAGALQDFDYCGDANTTLLKGFGYDYFSVPKFTPVKNFNGISPVGGAWKWGDFNNDGLLDVLATDDRNYTWGFGNMAVLKNNGNDSFSLIGTQIPTSHASAIDIDNDGKNELVVYPNSVYKWNGSQFELSYQADDPGDFTTYGNYMDFADFDKDGFVDAAFSHNGYISVLRNDQKGRLVNLNRQYGSAFPNQRFFKWQDMNRDGFPDIVTSSIGVLENTRGRGFIFQEAGIVTSGQSAVADFNKDSFPDIFRLVYQGSIGPTKMYYNQNGSFFFKEDTPLVFPDVTSGSAAEGALGVDIDNDGDEDLLHSSNGACISNGIMLNNYNFKNKNLHVQYPNGNEKIAAGGKISINWIGNKLTEVNIYYSTDSGVTFKNIVEGSSSFNRSGSFTWSIPSNISSAKCFIKIIDAYDGNIIDFSDRPFTISTVLPVTLVEFTARPSNNRSILSWTSMNEAGTKKYEIEHSRDASSFKTEGSVMSTPAAAYSKSYSFTHFKPVRGANFYRLKVFNKDNDFFYSQVRQVNFEKPVNINVYPNPVTNAVRITITNPGDKTGSVQILTTTGQRIAYENFDNAIEIDLKKYSPGIYLIHVHNNNITEIFKVYKR